MNADEQEIKNKLNDQIIEDSDYGQELINANKSKLKELGATPDAKKSASAESKDIANQSDGQFDPSIMNRIITPEVKHPTAKSMSSSAQKSCSNIPNINSNIM